MKRLLTFTFVLILAFFFTNFVIAGALHTWTDENGVTHISAQPPPENIEHEKTEYKKSSSSPTRHNPAKKKSDQYKIIQNRSEETKRKEIELLNLRKIELERKSADLEKKKQQRELQDAKRKYDHYMKYEATYRKRYHNANNKTDRDYYYEELKKADEAKTNYFRLKSKYRE